MLPVVANERAGAWYVRPQLRAHGQTAYFKSTDGHTGKWDFNLRRLNIHLLLFAAQQGGCVLVDVTRKGKRFPDALAKTVPLWCAVINVAVARWRSAHGEAADEARWDLRLHTAPSVPMTERQQMSDLVDGFAERLLNSAVDVGEIASVLRKPLRPIWITPVTRMFLGCRDGQPLWTAAEHAELDFVPIMCVSASLDPQHMQADDRPMLALPSRFEYVQGAADDSEMWAPGLSSELFWRLVGDVELVDTTPQQCERDVLEWLSAARERSQNDGGGVQGGEDAEGGDAGGASGGKAPFDWIGDTGIAVGTFRAAEPPACWEVFDVIINCGAREYAGNVAHSALGGGGGGGAGGDPPRKLYLRLDIPEGKKGQNQLFASIPVALDSVRGRFMAPGRRILVHCAQGKDRSVGIALALLLEYMDGAGRMSGDGEPCRGPLDKEAIRNRLLLKVNLHFLGAGPA
ncbi:tRNA A64-2'-O-ribosylphosphate transferase [Polyrhizophydium stewartii]|uniref:tRNA A64-2'-O-ribosylphosphate transferase n=1 Tax=Polyrhizophydium stewartii TaxID=2732419 RepID=A0ABR4NBX0_9FUNG